MPDETLPKTRAEAKRLGAAHYFTGKPCKHGHLAKRRTNDSHCAECENIINYNRRLENPVFWKSRDQLYYQRNADILRERARLSYHKHAAARLAQKHLYYLNNVEEKLAYNKDYYLRNRERILEDNKHYHQDNPDVNRIASRIYDISPKGKVRRIRRRVREEAVPGTHTAEDLIKIIAMGKKCVVCGKKFTKRDPPTIEHVIAISHELGTNDAGNLAPSHLSCNLSKGASRFNPITGQGILI